LLKGNHKEDERKDQKQKIDIVFINDTEKLKSYIQRAWCCWIKNKHQSV